MAAKRKSKILGQPSQALLYNSGLYISFLNIQFSFFPKKGLYLGGLTTVGFICFKFSGPIFGWAYNQYFTV